MCVCVCVCVIFTHEPSIHNFEDCPPPLLVKRSRSSLSLYDSHL